MYCRCVSPRLLTAESWVRSPGWPGDRTVSVLVDKMVLGQDSVSVSAVTINPPKLHKHFNLVGKTCGRRTRGPLGCVMLSAAIFANHLRTTKITRFSRLVFPLSAIFKRAVHEPAHQQGYDPSHLTRV
jgi:hypothetical protein